MKKILAIITSPIHLMEMVNLVLYDFKGISCDIAIDDYIPNAEFLVKNTKLTHLFNKVFLISYKKYNNDTGKYGKLVAKFLRNINPSRTRIQKRLRNQYPEMDFDYDTICFYDTWNFNNYIALSQTKVDNYIWLDDGFCSYTGVAFFNKGTVVDKIRSILKVNFLRDSITQQYLFHPELRNFSCDFSCKKLKAFDVHDDLFKKNINIIFGITEQFHFNQRYIYLDEPYEECGGKITNIDILNLFTPYLRKGELLIKMHPRCKPEQYMNEYKILNANGIPWEVIYLNLNASDAKSHLIGVFSYALATPFLIFNERTPVIVLLKLLDLEKFDKTTLQSLTFVKKIFDNYPEVFLQPKNSEELRSLLK